MFQEVIAPPTRWGLMGHKVGNHWMIKVGNLEPQNPIRRKRNTRFFMVQLWSFISYNWLFQWDNKQSINGVLLVLITGITRAITVNRNHNMGECLILGGWFLFLRDDCSGSHWKVG